MKTLLKQKVNADQTSQSNGFNPMNRIVTRQAANSTSYIKVELVDTGRKGQTVDADNASKDKQQKSVQSVQGVKRPYPSNIQSSQSPMYASTVNVQHDDEDDDDADMDDSYSGSSASGSYSQSAKRPTGSVLRNTLSGPTESNNGRVKNRPGRKPTKAVENLSAEDYQRLEDRRKKNKEAAQRCRSRRMEKIQELEQKIKDLNGEISLLKSTHEKFKAVPSQLKYYLGPNTHVCQLATTPPTSNIPMSMIGMSMEGTGVHMHMSQGMSGNDPQASTSAAMANRPLAAGAGKTLNSPTSRAASSIKRPQFLNKPLTNIIAEQKRPSSQPSPSVTLYPFFAPNLQSSGTPGLEFLASPSGGISWVNGTPQLPSFGNTDGFLLDDRTPSREMNGSALYNALDLHFTPVLETPNAEGPRLTSL